MVYKRRDLLGVGIGMEYTWLAQHELHGLVCNGKKQPLESLDFVIMLAVNNRQTDDAIVKPLGLMHIFQGFFGQQL